MASIRGAKGRPHGKGKIRHMRIEPAKNGFTSTISREPSSSPGQPGMFMGSSEEPPTIHPSISHLTKHVKATFAPGEPGEPDEDDQAEQA